MPFILFLFSLIVFSAQSAFIGLFSFNGVTPDLILILAVYCGINFQGNGGVGMGCALGLAQDCLSGGVLGINTLSKGLIGFFFSALKNKIMVDGVIPICFFLMLSSFFDVLVFYTVWSLLLKGESSGVYLFPDFLIYAGYNAFAGPLLFFIFNRGKKWIMLKFPNQALRPL
ncbi:MAG: rod shape-determining protein MreD [Nitrospinae bacterium RIFCSPLOWO2_12_FULL_47_7]|nr:MAG: rod shape-determining protein MreD [Nitrospinae bacterium RIFCSPLOWO2_12_FULL_47_7]